MDKHSVLKTYFGHTAFRQGQEALIDAILSGRDALGIMPTGGGKSLCYQIPALLLPGVTLVISPLISLMKDQVAALERSGIPAAYINSTLSLEELRQVYRRTRQGAYKLLYVAPERLDTEGFASLVREMDISLAAVDEAHCISQWGQNFRPSYLKISDFVASLPHRPVVAAFTATATVDVQRDIVRLLDLDAPVSCVTGFDRPNLFFDVQRPKNKLSALLTLLRQRRDKTGIVYCATRASAESVCEALCEAGISAVCYHAGMEDDARRRSCRDATQPTGMGDYHAFDVLDDVAADLHQHPVRQRTQHAAGLGGGVSDGDGLGAAGGEAQLLPEDLHILPVARIVSFHTTPPALFYPSYRIPAGKSIFSTR